MRELRTPEEIMISNNLTVDHCIELEDIDNIIQAIKIAQIDALEVVAENVKTKSVKEKTPFSPPESPQYRMVSVVDKESILKLRPKV